MQIDVGHGVNAHKIVSEDNTMYILENTREIDFQNSTVEEAKVSKTSLDCNEADLCSLDRELQLVQTSGGSSVKPTRSHVSPKNTATALALKRLRDHKLIITGDVQTTSIDYDKNSSSDASLSFASGSDSDCAQDNHKFESKTSEPASEFKNDMDKNNGSRREVKEDKGKGKVTANLSTLKHNVKAFASWADVSEEEQLAWALAQSNSLIEVSNERISADSINSPKDADVASTTKSSSSAIAVNASNGIADSACAIQIKSNLLAGNAAESTNQTPIANISDYLPRLVNDTDSTAGVSSTIPLPAGDSCSGCNKEINLQSFQPDESSASTYNQRQPKIIEVVSPRTGKVVNDGSRDDVDQSSDVDIENISINAGESARPSIESNNSTSTERSNKEAQSHIAEHNVTTFSASTSFPENIPTTNIKYDAHAEDNEQRRENVAVYGTALNRGNEKNVYSSGCKRVLSDLELDSSSLVEVSPPDGSSVREARKERNGTVEQGKKTDPNQTSSQIQPQTHSQTNMQLGPIGTFADFFDFQKLCKLS